ncbi:anti-sigma factor domain-containing protein [Paenibacillus jamilae]|uniref:RsgI N-terminal anti-sigma domain-containing protein n=1 Tax=Bacillus thuringiensis serovar subtoxicus TaxID=475791 RepID=A0A9X6FNA3_BACTU|nr:anti-sigma factor domain-containing protein [Bacillus thuringiensis]MEB4844217.1 anti-sigma factor domain-containing protein [Paenibacillus jamilae]MEB8581891.1 anti-sigma factor domain-containing protein [Bacillus cereus]MCR6852884.1 anti-sigma factor domain-containing protein [Bacillus thuringiensis]MDR4287036.1 anti-sigma factor domain-containing protein [Bacillus thuringiensis]MEB8594036.1 anti-sigma factor domain-containing protein [Bacillus cereus]
MMNKGIVMDIKKHSVVVLTPNGEFITCKRKGDSCMIGEEISFDEQEQKASHFSIPSFLKPASILVACFLFAVLFFYNQPEEKVFAYVSVDINPSLEVSVTKDFRVIDLQACNDDGRRILKELKQWENKQLQEVIRTIIKQSQEDKYLTNDKQVMLTAVAKDKALEPQLEKAMKELKKEYELKHITVEYQSSTMQVRENARKAGIGTGVYIKQENEKNKSLTPPPATPPNPVGNEEEVQSQPESSPDASMDLSPVDEKKYEKQEQKEQKKTEEQPSKQIKENNGRGSQQENRGNQQENKSREAQQGNNGNQQGNNGRGSQQGNNGNGQGSNGRGSQQGNNGNGQGNNGRESQQGNNGQGNNGRESQQGNNGNEQGNNGRESQQGNNGNGQGNNGRGSQKENGGNEQGNNGRGSQQENRGHQQGNEKKNQ